MNQSEKPSKDEIAARAYQIYVQEGRMPGREIDHWLRAEASLLRERQAAQEAAAARNVAPPVAEDWRTGDGDNRRANQPRSARRASQGASRIP